MALKAKAKQAEANEAEAASEAGGTEGEAARIRRDDTEAGEATETLLPIGEMSDAKLVLTDELMKRGADSRAARLHQDTTE